MGVRPRQKHQFFQNCWGRGVVGKGGRRFQGLFLTLRSLFFVFVFLCVFVGGFPFLCAYIQRMAAPPFCCPQPPGERLVKGDKLGAEIRHITYSLCVFGHVIS